MNLTSGGISDAGLAHFANCSKLKVLALNHTSITEKGLAALGPLPELQNLDVGWTQLSGAGILRSYPNLKVLNLGPALEDEGLAQLAGLSGLTHLNLVGRKGEFTAKGVANFRSCKKLQHLALSWNAGSDDVMAEIKNWPALTNLSLNSAAVTDKGLQQLKECKTLKILSITSAPVFVRLSQAAIDDFRKDRPDVEVRVAPGSVKDSK